MSYVLTGRLRARMDENTVEPVANQTVLLYWVPSGEDGSFTIRSHDEARAREYLLLAQGRTDARGEFRIDMGEDTLMARKGSRRTYAGEPLSLEIYCRGTDGTTNFETEEVQFSLGHLQPSWENHGDHFHGTLEHELTADQWRRVREAQDSWTIAGRVVRDSDQSPLPGMRVFAYDVDTVQDDFLGSAITGEDGSFRIDYPGSAFRQTSVGVGYERGGPEIYFRVETADGKVVYTEPRSRGNDPDRANSPNWFSTELRVNAASL